MVPEITPGPEMSAPRAVGRPWAWSMQLSLPNLITLARLLSVPLAIWLIVDRAYGAAFWVLVAAGLSDGLDGYIAKRFDRRTPLGAVLDPAADKTLLVGLCLTLALTGQIPVWLVALVILRDLLIVLGFVAIRAVVAPRQLTPLTISRINTLVQIALVGFVLGREGFGLPAEPATGLLIAAAATTTVLSGLAYLLRVGRLLAGTERVS